ncbi:MAG: zinc ribbon domain-containing protein [Anaerolineae bacterium]|nr:zinc ribbon domain-containing protein [Anaerolineae bacterium]
MQPTPNTPASSGGNVYEMQWDCKFCGTKKLLGKTHRFCPNCGGQQDPSWRYFPSDSEKVAVKDHVYVGADKICSACQSVSAASAEFCGNCGAPLDRAKQAAQGAERDKAEGEAFETEDVQERRKQKDAGVQTAPAPKPQAATNNRGCLVIGLILIALVAGAVFLFTRTSSASAYVTNFRWERQIAVESLQALPASGSCDSVPVDAYGNTRRYEQVGSERVPDGETCRNVQVDQGDGTFREERRCETKYRSEPVYGYVCYYTINRWASSRVSEAEGDRTSELAWPNPNLRTGTCLGCERESGRTEAYYLVLKGDDREFECPVPFDQWQNTRLEQGFTVEIGTVLQNVRCETLKPVS